MRKSYLAILFLLINMYCFAQGNFEGHIRYNAAITPIKGDHTTSITAYFKNNFIKTVTTELMEVEDQNNSVVRIFDFNTGISYTIDSANKVTIKDSIENNKRFKKNTLSIIDSVTSINKYECYGYAVTPYIRQEELKNALVWYAKNLPFSVPDKFKLLDEIMLFTDGENVGLGFNANLIVDDSAVSIKVQPSEIVAEQLPDSMFYLPAGNKSYFHDEYSKILMEKFKTVDSTFSIHSDAEMTENSLKDKPKKAPQKKKPKKTPLKSTIYKRKQ